MIRALISDFGGVLTNPLLESFRGVSGRLGISFEQLGEAMQAITERDGENPLFPLERGEVTEAEFLGNLSAQIGADLSRFNDHYFEALTVNEPMVSWLRRARDGYDLRLALLTNNVREWGPKWRAMLPIDELFEVVVDSAFVGLRKPDPRIYELTLQRLDLPGVACLFIEDLEHNCDAATALGMQAVWFQDTVQAIAELEALLG